MTPQGRDLPGRALARWWMPIALLALAPLFWMLATAFADRANLLNQAIFKFWLAGHLIAGGQSPYDAELWARMHHEMGVNWFPNRIFLYPPAMAYLLVPIGQLGLREAFLVWGTGLQLAVAASVFLLVRTWEKQPPALFVPFILLVVCLFAPFTMSVANSTMGGPFLLLLSLAVRAAPPRSSFWRGALVGVLTLKPSLGVPVCGVVGLWMLVRRDWTGIAGIVASVGLIAGVNFLHDPSWITKLHDETSYHVGDVGSRQPTITNVSAAVCGTDVSCETALTWTLWGALFARLVWLVVTKARVLSAAAVTGLAVTWALVATPYVWPYDYILLVLPMLWIAGHLYPLRSSVALPAAFLLAMTELAYVAVSGVEGRDSSYLLFLAVPGVTWLAIEGLLYVLPRRSVAAGAAATEF